MASINKGSKLRLRRLINTYRLYDEVGKSLDDYTSINSRTSPLFCNQSFFLKLNSEIDGNQKLGISKSGTRLNRLPDANSNLIDVDIRFCIDRIGNTNIKELTLAVYCKVLISKNDKSCNIFLTGIGNSFTFSDNINKFYANTYFSHSRLYLSAFEVIEAIKSEVKKLNVYHIERIRDSFEFKVLDYKSYRYGLSVFPSLGDLESLFRLNHTQKMSNIIFTFNEYINDKESKLKIGMTSNSGVNLVNKERTDGFKDYFCMNLVESFDDVSLEELRIAIRDENFKLSEIITELDKESTVIHCSNVILNILETKQPFVEQKNTTQIILKRNGKR